MHLQLMQKGAFAPTEGQPGGDETGLLARDPDIFRFQTELEKGTLHRPDSLTARLMQYTRRRNQGMSRYAGVELMRPRTFAVTQRHDYIQSFRQKSILKPFLWEQHTLVNFLRRRRHLLHQHRQRGEYRNHYLH